MAEPRCNRGNRDAIWNVDSVGPKNHVLDAGPDRHTWSGKFQGEKSRPCNDMPGHVQRPIYSKPLSRGQHRYGADADLGIVDRVHIGQPGEYDWTVRLRRRCGLMSKITSTPCLKGFISTKYHTDRCTVSWAFRWVVIRSVISKDY